MPEELQDKVVKQSLVIKWMLNANEFINEEILPDLSNIIKNHAISDGLGFFNKPDMQNNGDSEQPENNPGLVK